MSGTDKYALAEEFVVRPPRQERSRRAWARVLDAGVALLEEGGYEAFTIAAVCDRAKVAPRAIYDRTPSKESLFLAVYEYRTSRIWEELRVFEDGGRWGGLDAPQLVAAAVTELADIFHRNEAFLRALMPASPAHGELHRRACGHSRRLAAQFTRLLLAAGPRITHPDPEEAVRMCFNAVYAALMMRIGHGPDGVLSVADRGVFVRHLAEMAVRYLLGRGPDGSAGLPWPQGTHRSSNGGAGPPDAPEPTEEPERESPEDQTVGMRK